MINFAEKGKQLLAFLKDKANELGVTVRISGASHK